MEDAPYPVLHHYAAQRSAREPLLRWILDALRASGCVIIEASDPTRPPFKISFILPTGERMGIVAYAFLANSRPTRNRPEDEARFQIKYGSKADGGEHAIWQDPFGLYTTLMLGINPDDDYFVAIDPVLHSPTKFFISVEFKHHHIDEIARTCWHVWERERGPKSTEPIEVMVGGNASTFLRLVGLEREALGESQGHRQLVAERMTALPSAAHSALALTDGVARPGSTRLHELAREFGLSERQVMDLIAQTPRLKMAVRGWVAEQHLVRYVEQFSEASEVHAIATGGEIDVSFRWRGSRPIGIQCKNVLRKTNKDGLARLDFQRTRAAIGDPCSRYYKPGDFDLVAACLNAVTEDWSYAFNIPGRLAAHAKCPGRLASNVLIDSNWSADLADLIQPVLSM